MAKVLKSGGGMEFAHGGKSGQVGKTSGPARSVGPQKPGVSSQEGSGSGKFAVGGKGHMVGQSGANPQKPGQSATATSGKGSMWAKGGGSGMAPNRGSQPAQGGKSSAY